MRTFSLPDQTNNAGYVLKTDGMNVFWGPDGGLANITGLIEAGNNISLSGVGSLADPYIINAMSQNLSLTVITGAGDVTITDDFVVWVINKSVGASTQVNLPATPAVGDSYHIKDGKGDAFTNNITINPDGATLIDGASTYIMNSNYQSVRIIWNGTQWNII